MKTQPQTVIDFAQVSRATDAKFINTVVNDPSVYEWVHGTIDGPLDLTPLVTDISNVLLIGEHGGMLFIHHQPGLYDIHTQVLPSGRGKWCLNFSREALRWMFTRTPAVELVTRVPQGNLGALALVRANKMSKNFSMDRGWFRNGQPVPASSYSMTVQDWMQEYGSAATGSWFLKRMSEEYAKHGVNISNSLPEDHLKQIGSAIEMIFGGQKEKGVVFYNRWASMAGATPARIVTLNPLVIECQGALIKFRSNDFWIMSCP